MAVNVSYGKIPTDDSASAMRVLNAGELQALVDEVTGVNAYTLNGEEARFKIDLGQVYQISEIKYFTDETVLGNVEITTSINDSAYTGRSLSQESGYIKATVAATVRWIKVSHDTTPSATIANVKDIQTIGDDTRVDFGAAGATTEQNFDSVPVGTPSPIQTVKIYNDHGSPTISAKCSIKADGSEGSRMTEVSDIDADTADLTASQTYDASAASGSADNAFDDAPGSSWTTTGSNVDEWVSCQFGSAKRIRKLTFKGTTGSASVRYAKLEASNNGVDWTKIPAVAWGNGAVQYNTDEIEFIQSTNVQYAEFDNDTDYTYYRLYCILGWGQIYVLEIEMMELIDWKSHCTNNDLTNHVCLQSNPNYASASCNIFCSQYNKAEVYASDQTIVSVSTCDVFVRSNIPAGEGEESREAELETEMEY